MSTPIFICGAECGVNAVGAAPTGNLKHWSTFGATVAVDTVNVPDFWSTRSYKFNPSANNSDTLAHLFGTAIASPAVMVVRFRIMFTVLPNSVHSIVSDAGGLCGIRYNTSGTKLEAWAGSATTTVAGSFVPTVGVWYRIDARFTRGTTHSVDWQVDGSAQTQASKASQSASTITGVTFGHQSAGQAGSTNTTATFNIDDICTSGTTGDYPLGVGQVVGLQPAADGTHSFTANDFKYNATGAAIATNATDVYTHLTGPLDNISDFVSQVVIRTTGYLEVAFGTTPALSAVNGINVVSSHHAEGTPGQSVSLRLEDGATENAILAGVDFSETSIIYNEKVYATAPSSGSAWTKTKVDALKVRWGYSGDVSPNPDLDGLCIEVDLVTTDKRMSGKLATADGAKATTVGVTRPLAVPSNIGTITPNVVNQAAWTNRTTDGTFSTISLNVSKLSPNYTRTVYVPMLFNASTLPSSTTAPALNGVQPTDTMLTSQVTSTQWILLFQWREADLPQNSRDTAYNITGGVFSGLNTGTGFLTAFEVLGANPAHLMDSRYYTGTGTDGRAVEPTVSSDNSVVVYVEISASVSAWGGATGPDIIVSSTTTNNNTVGYMVGRQDIADGSATWGWSTMGNALHSSGFMVVSAVPGPAPLISDSAKATKLNQTKKFLAKTPESDAAKGTTGTGTPTLVRSSE